MAISHPKISVLMPCFNTEEKYLRETIESILNQTFKDFEFLIINDGSTDKKVEETIKSYKDERIKYIWQEKNLGISQTRNKLIALSQGQYLAVTDHDDISLPDRFQKEIDYLEANKDIGIVSCYIRKTSSKQTYKVQIEDEDIKLALLTACELWHSACMMRKNVLIDNNILYEETFSPAEDYALFCRLIPHTKFHNLPEVLFIYRVHQKQTSLTAENKMRDADFKVRQFVHKDNPALVYKKENDIPSFTIIKLFGFMPFLKIRKTYRKNIVYLFFIIPIFTYKTRKILNGLFLGRPL